MEFPGQGDERLAIFRSDVGGVRDGKLSGSQSLAGDEAQDVEGVVGCGLIVLVIGNESTAVIARQNLGTLEVFARKGRLSANELKTPIQRGYDYENGPLNYVSRFRPGASPNHKRKAWCPQWPCTASSSNHDENVAPVCNPNIANKCSHGTIVSFE